MYGVVSVETLATEASNSGYDDRLPQSKLVFNDGVHDSMPLRARDPLPRE